MKNFGNKLFGRLGMFFALASVMVLVSCGDDDTPSDPPVASFTSTVSELTVTVDNTSTGATNYSWDFGDGSDPLTIEEGSYTYSEGGEYTITLTAINDGGEATATETITVSAPCTPEAGGDVVEAGNINLNMSGDVKFFDSFGGRQTSLVDNPDLNGNESCKVMQWVATTAGCETWGGAGWRIGFEPGAGANDAYGTGGPLNFDNMSGTFTLDVWGPAGTTVNLRLERLGFPDVTPVQEIQQTKAAAGWETLTFNFVAQDLGNNADGSDGADGLTDTYESIIMYINKDACPSADETYYVDNLVQGS